MSDFEILRSAIAREISKPVPNAVKQVAAAAIERHRPASLCALFYGSCIDKTEFESQLIDLYIVVSDYRRAYVSPIEAAANRLLAPNVYYLEASIEGITLRSKYAVVSLPQLKKLVSASTLNPYFWARLSQPFRALHADPAVLDEIERIALLAIEAAVAARPDNVDAMADLYRHTYRTEFRPEKVGRPDTIVERHRAFFTELESGLATADRHRHGRVIWWIRRIQGKSLTILRLLKAALTFRGGADYLAWKVRRHSGVEIMLSRWQKQHPILASPAILWRLWRDGAIR